MSLFQGKYRVESARLRHWDYAGAGWCFVTICTRGGECFLGNVVDGDMHLSPIGEIARQYWAEIPHHFRNVELDSFVIMPNHVHGIVIIKEHAAEDCRDVACNVSTANAACNVSSAAAKSAHQHMSGISPKAGSLSVVVRSYKSAVTRYCRQNGYSDFG